MQFKPQQYLSLALLVLLYLYNLDVYSIIILVSFTYFTLDFVDNIGKKIGILDLIPSIALLQWLVMPVVAYYIFDENNELANLWQTFMPIEKNSYFSYAVPATLLFIFGLKYQLFKGKKPTDYEVVRNTKDFLKNKSNIGLVFLGIGILATYVSRILPESIASIGQNFAFLTYIGLFYVIFSDFKQKSIIIAICFFLMLMQVVASGMFTEFVKISIFFSLIILLGRNINFFSKMLLMIFASIILLTIQSVKIEYRNKTWDLNGKAKGDAGTFQQILGDRIANPIKIIEEEALFNTAVRANQGLINAQIMAYIPKTADYAYGSTIIKSTVSAFVPRFIWADKPRFGGAENVCRFLGDCNAKDKLTNYSYNISVLGEAYGNFGRIGGCFFMFLFGLFVNYLYSKIFLFSKTYPTLLLWLPMLFIGAIIQEGDVLEFINAFVKSAFFIFLVYKTSKILFDVRI